jgi:hypothetical protein
MKFPPCQVLAIVWSGEQARGVEALSFVVHDVTTQQAKYRQPPDWHKSE